MIFLNDMQTKPKKRQYWLVGSPSSRKGHAPKNENVLFQILEITASKCSAANAATDTVNQQVLPFYTSKGSYRFWKKIVKVWMMMMKEGIFRSLAHSPPPPCFACHCLTCPCPACPQPACLRPAPLTVAPLTFVS